MTMAKEIKRKDKGAVNVQISLKALVPVVPQTPMGRRELEEDLEHIECVDLLNKSWSLKDEGLVKELVQGVPNQFDLIVRGKPERWTALAWRETYGLKPEGYGWASRTDKYIVGQFSKSRNPKDGFAVSDCEDFCAKQVLEFLIPILYLEKPTQVTITVENTIFGALMGDRLVDWGLLFYDVVESMVEGQTNHGLPLFVPSI